MTNLMLSCDNKNELVKNRKGKVHPKSKLTGLLVGEWSHPLCSKPLISRLMGPKIVAGEDQTGFSPYDRKRLELNYFY